MAIISSFLFRLGEMWLIVSGMLNTEKKLKTEIKAHINKIGVGEWLHSLLPVGVFATTWAPMGQEVMHAHGSQTSMP